MQKFKIQTAYLKMLFAYINNTLYQIRTDDKGKERLMPIKGGSIDEVKSYVESVYGVRMQRVEVYR